MKAIHRERLKKLADYLLNKVPANKFDMSLYRIGTDREHICGTAGCALGWAPAIMAPSTFLRYRSEFEDVDDLFTNISTKYFGIEGWRYEGDWAYIFSGNWCSIDNTPQGAAARIRFFLDNGVPEKHTDYWWDTSHYQKYLNN